MDQDHQQLWAPLAARLRADAIRSTTAAGSGHPTSALSAADLMAVLLASHLRYDVAQPRHPGNDHLIFSKGHAAPLLYAMHKAMGAIDDPELLTLRKAGSRLEGHPTPALPWVEAATGSLGQGLPIGVGIALAGKRLDHLRFRTWVLVGDSEMSEGSVWEALQIAGHYRLDRLVAIVDVNRLGQRGETMLGWDVAAHAERIAAFGWETVVVDGHDHQQIDEAYRRADAAERPTCIIARTEKGHGVSFLADRGGLHGTALSARQADEALAELRPPGDLTVVPAAPLDAPTARAANPTPPPVALPRWRRGDQVATRQAYGEALAALGAARPRVVALDGEVSNSTMSELFQRAHPERFIELYIAEQQLVSAAQGLAIRGWIPFASTFAAFFTRAHDQLRMAALSRADLRLCGSHAGVSIGEDGPSQMALEDLAMMRALEGSTVLYPCDAVATADLVRRMADQRGICFLRTTRAKTTVLYEAHDEFPIGGSKVLRHGDEDQAAIVAAGITVHQALEAAGRLGDEGIPIRVIDCYSVKPIDGATLRAAADACGHLVVVEDHRPEGGLGEAVIASLACDGGAMPAITHLAVRGLPGSASPDQQLDRHGLSARAIIDAVRARAATVMRH